MEYKPDVSQALDVFELAAVGMSGEMAGVVVAATRGRQDCTLTSLQGDAGSLADCISRKNPKAGFPPDRPLRAESLPAQKFRSRAYSWDFVVSRVERYTCQCISVREH